MPCPPGRPEPIPVWPVWNSAGTRGFADRLVDRIEATVVRLEALHARMELEALDAVVADQLVDAVHRAPLVPRVDAAERDQHVVVAHRARDEVLDGVRLVAHRRARVDGEHHRGGVVPAVLVGQRVDARQRARLHLEVLADGVDELVVIGLAAVAVDLHVGVDVDGRDAVEIDSVFVFLARH